MTPSQARLLLGVVENRYDTGTETINESRRIMGAHAQNLLDDEQMLIKALEINRRDQERFAHYMPQQPTSLKQAIAQGPAQPQQIPNRKVDAQER